MIRHFCKLLSLATVLAVAGETTISQAAPIVHACGPVIKSRVKTETAEFFTSSTSFVNVTGTQTAVVVPAGQTYCVKIRFSAVMQCSATASVDRCVIRVLAGASLADPALDVVVFAGEDGGNYGVRSFQWVKELGPGRHVVRAQAKVQNAVTMFNIRTWTLDVETTE
jgi:hypothetical protein